MDLWHFEFLEGGPKRPKICKNLRKLDLSILVFIIFAPSPRGNPFKSLHPNADASVVLGKLTTVHGGRGGGGKKI